MEKDVQTRGGGKGEGGIHTHTLLGETESSVGTCHEAQKPSSVMAQTERPGGGGRSAREGWMDAHR